MTRGACSRTILPLGCHCGSQSWFSGCLLQWLMSYFIFFLGLSRKNGAWEGSFTAFKSISVPWVSRPLPHKVHIYLMCLTPLFFLPNSIKPWFELRDIETQSRRGSSAHSLCGQCKNRQATISPLETQAIFFNSKGAEMRKSRHLLLSLYCFLFFLSLSPSLCLIGTAVQRERWSEW